MQFTTEELQAIYQLLSRTNINGGEAKAVALLQQKIEGLLSPAGAEKEAKKSAT